jgi:hypothetical protein
MVFGATWGDRARLGAHRAVTKYYIRYYGTSCINVITYVFIKGGGAWLILGVELYRFNHARVNDLEFVKWDAIDSQILNPMTMRLRACQARTSTLHAFPRMAGLSSAGCEFEGFGIYYVKRVHWNMRCYWRQLDLLAGDAFELIGVRFPQGLESLAKLDVLDLHNNAIESVEGLQHVTGLRILNLAGNKIKRCAMKYHTHTQTNNTYDYTFQKRNRQLNWRFFPSPFALYKYV